MAGALGFKKTQWDAGTEEQHQVMAYISEDKPDKALAE